MLRVLVVEDAEHRMRRIRACAPPSVRLVHAATGGQAIGVLLRDPADTYQGILLDHDLKELHNGDDRCGMDVARVIARHCDPMPVLVHSMNPSGGDRMAAFLADNGFDVQRVPFRQLDSARLCTWFSRLASSLETPQS
jgi:CheY-like chemotaxis protein